MSTVRLSEDDWLTKCRRTASYIAAKREEPSAIWFRALCNRIIVKFIVDLHVWKRQRVQSDGERIVRGNRVVRCGCSGILL